MPKYTMVLLGAATPAARMIRKIAEGIGAEFAIGESGTKLMWFEPDIALVEVGSPEALESLKRMVRRRGDQQVPILALVPSDANGLLQQARSAGADGFIFTPIHETAARTTLETYCRLSCLERGHDAVVRQTATYNEEVDDWMSLIASAPNLMIRLDRDARVEFANRTKFLDVPVKGKRIQELMPNLDDEFERIFHRLVHRGLPGYYETAVEHETLGVRHYMLFLGPIVGGGGVNSVAVVVVDVTTRRHEETAMRHNHAELVALIETAPGAIGLLDREGRVSFQNNARLISEEAYVSGTPLLEFLEPDAAAEVAEELKRAFDRDEVVSATYRLGERWFDARMRRVKVDTEDRVLMFANDVTRRVESEEALRQTIRRIELLQQHLPIAFFEGKFSWDTENEKLVVEDLIMSKEIGGMEIEEAFDMGAYIGRIHPDDRDVVVESWISFAQGSTDSWEHEYRVDSDEADDGAAARWVLVRGLRVDGAHGIGFVVDVTDRKILEDRLVQASKMEAIGRLAGGVAHDFNNLLTSIVNFTWYVRDELPEGSPLRDDLSEVLKAAESGARLTGQLLAFSRRKPSEPTVVELNDRIDQVYRVLERTIGENVRLVFNRSPAQLPVVIEASQLDQMIFNLAVNARDAMPNGGTLTLTLRREGEFGILEVSDDGVGIPRGIQSQLFEPFFSTKGENGTGLGLATCYGIARQSGGDIRVSSVDGEGATFTASLPLAAREEDPQTERAITATRTKPLSLALVVEDQPAILKLVHRALEHAGWDVRTAATAEEALEIAAGLEREPAVLLTDVVLPGKSGVDLARELRERWPDLPVLLTSGYLGDEYEPAMATGGRTAFVPKPFNSVQLLTRLAVLLE